jgi:hypothetical protein
VPKGSSTAANVVGVATAASRTAGLAGTNVGETDVETTPDSRTPRRSANGGGGGGGGGG